MACSYGDDFMSEKNHQQPELMRIGHLVVLLERLLRKELTEALLPANLTVQQYGALFFLAQREKITNASFAKQFLMTPQSANEMISALEKKALVVRQPDENHGRMIGIKLSKEGRRILRKADTAVLKIEQRMLDCIPVEARNQFHDHLVNCLSALLPTAGDTSSPIDEILVKASFTDARKTTK